MTRLLRPEVVLPGSGKWQVEVTRRQSGEVVEVMRFTDPRHNSLRGWLIRLAPLSAVPLALAAFAGVQCTLDEQWRLDWDVPDLLALDWPAVGVLSLLAAAGILLASLRARSRARTACEIAAAGVSVGACSISWDVRGPVLHLPADARARDVGGRTGAYVDAVALTPGARFEIEWCGSTLEVGIERPVPSVRRRFELVILLLLVVTAAAATVALLATLTQDDAKPSTSTRPRTIRRMVDYPPRWFNDSVYGPFVAKERAALSVLYWLGNDAGFLADACYERAMERRGWPRHRPAFSIAAGDTGGLTALLDGVPDPELTGCLGAFGRQYY